MDARTMWSLVLLGSLSLSALLVSTVSYPYLSSEARLQEALDHTIEDEAFLLLLAEDAGTILSSFVTVSGGEGLVSRLHDALSITWTREQGRIVISSFLDQLGGEDALSRHVSITPLKGALASHLASLYPLSAASFEKLIPDTLPVSIFLDQSVVDGIDLRYTLLSYVRYIGGIVLALVVVIGYKLRREIPLGRSLIVGGVISTLASIVGMFSIAAYVRETADALGYASISSYADALAALYMGHVWPFMLVPLFVTVAGLFVRYMLPRGDLTA